MKDFTCAIRSNSNENSRSPIRKKLLSHHKNTIIKFLEDGVPVREQQKFIAEIEKNKNLTYEIYRKFLEYSFPIEYEIFLKNNFLLSKHIRKFSVCQALERFDSEDDQYAFLKEHGILKAAHIETRLSIEDYKSFVKKFGSDLLSWWNESGKDEYELYIARNAKKSAQRKGIQNSRKNVSATVAQTEPDKNKTKTKEKLDNTHSKDKNNDPSEAQLNLENKISSDGRFKPWKPENFKESIRGTNEVLFREDVTEEYLLRDVVRRPGMHNVIDEFRQFAVELEDIELYERFKEDGYFQKGDLIYLQHEKNGHSTLYRLWDNFELVKLREDIWEYTQIFGRYFEVAGGNFEIIKFLNGIYGHVIKAMKGTPHESVKEELREIGVVV